MKEERHATSRAKRRCKSASKKDKVLLWCGTLGIQIHNGRIKPKTMTEDREDYCLLQYRPV